MAKVWKRKDRDVWVADFRDGTGRRVRLMAPDRAKAEELLAEKIKEKKHSPANIEDRDITLANYAERWLDTAKTELAPKTLHSYRQLLDLHILPTLGSVKVHGIRRKAVKTLLNEKRAAGLSKNTVRLIKAALSTVLSEAVEDEILMANPALNVGRRRKQTSGQLTQTEVLSQIHPMTWAQKQTFEEALDGLGQAHRLDSRYAMLFLLMIKTGLRPGEALALQQGDLDLVSQTVRVERALTLKGQVKLPKTHETRFVDLSAALVSRLRTYLTWRETMTGRWMASPSLFPNEHGNLFDESKALKVFHRVLKVAELPSFRLYDLRHTYASLLLSDGVPLLYVSKQLGHTKPTTTLRYYAHWVPSGEKRLVDALDRPVHKVGTKTWHQVDRTEQGDSKGIENEWSRRVGSNHRPADYEAQKACWV